MVVSEKPIMMSAVVNGPARYSASRSARVDQVEGAVDPRLHRAKDGLSSGSFSRFRIISRPIAACSVPLAK